MVERFFFYLNRINAVLLFTALTGLAIFVGFQWAQSDLYDDLRNARPDQYGAQGLDGQPEIQGEEIGLSDGAVVKYTLEGQGEFDIEVDARNISLTHGVTGKSRLVLPRDSEQLVLRFEHIGMRGEGQEPANAYIALVGSEQDFADGKLDLIIGRLTDLDQQVVARRIRFVDSPRMIDENTLSLIAWSAADQAEFWLFDLRTMQKTLMRAVELPLPDQRVESSSD